MLVLLFSFVRNFSEVPESMATQVLVKGNTLGEFLEHLVPSLHAKLAFHIKGQLGLERFWGYDLDTSERLNSSLKIESLNVVYRTFELLLAWPENGHGIDQLEVFQVIF